MVSLRDRDLAGQTVKSVQEICNLGKVGFPFAHWRVSNDGARRAVYLRPIVSDTSYGTRLLPAINLITSHELVHQLMSHQRLIVPFRNILAFTPTFTTVIRAVKYAHVTHHDGLP